MSTPSPKDYTVLICHHVLYVDCILTGFTAYWSSNKKKILLKKKSLKPYIFSLKVVPLTQLFYFCIKPICQPDLMCSLWHFILVFMISKVPRLPVPSMPNIFKVRKRGNEPESIHSSTTPDPGY